MIVKATKVDGVYDRDPNTDPQAKRYDRVSYTEALTKRLKVCAKIFWRAISDFNEPYTVASRGLPTWIRNTVGEPLVCRGAMFILDRHCGAHISAFLNRREKSRNPQQFPLAISSSGPSTSDQQIVKNYLFSLPILGGSGVSNHQAPPSLPFLSRHNATHNFDVSPRGIAG